MNDTWDDDDAKFFPSIKLIKCCLVFGVLFAFIGLPYYHDEAEKIKFYQLTNCSVYAVDYQREACRVGDESQDCIRPIWRLRPLLKAMINTIVQSKLYEILEEAVEEGEKYPVNSLSPCWYDTRLPSAIQWEKPSTEFGEGLLIISGVIGATCLGLVILRKYRYKKFKTNNNTAPSLEC